MNTVLDWLGNIASNVLVPVALFAMGYAIKVLKDIRNELKELNTHQATQEVRITTLEGQVKDHEYRIRDLTR